MQLKRLGAAVAEGFQTMMPFDKADDYGALLAVYRDVGDKARIGVGYSWGGVKDDLRSFETSRDGIFLNLIGKF